MRRIIWLNSAVDDLVRLRGFVAKNNSKAAKKASQTIKEAAIKLGELPNFGRSVEGLPNHKDLHIRFGAAGYVMRYKIYQSDIYIVHIRHYRESSFVNEEIN